MKKFFLRTMKSLALAAGLFASASGMAANEIGQPVTEFTDAEYMKLNFPYGIEGTTRTLLRYNVLTFKVTAPADGTYAVEFLVNTTGNNIQLATTATLDDSNSGVDIPDYSAFAHVLQTTDSQLPEPVEETTPDPNAEDSTEVEPVEPYVPAEPVCMYTSVDLKAGVNYVRVWMHIYWRNDALAPQKVMFQQIRVLPEGSGKVASVAQRASLKAFRVKYFNSLQDATTANVVSNYEALLKAIKADYATADTTACVADITAANLKEDAVRHGKGVIVGQDSTRIDLLLYHSEYNNPTTMAPLGGYDESGAYEMELGQEDYPAQLEFTRTNYFTYKFTAADNLPEGGSWYIQYLASSNNSASINMTILAEDSTTVIMPTYNLSTANGAWQNYEFMDKRDVAKFQMEPGKTYYLHMYYHEYTNVRDILIRYTPKEYHTVDQLEELVNEAQAKLFVYQEGTDQYYAVEDRTLLDNLQTAVDEAEEVAMEGDPEKVDAAYEKLADAIIALENLKVLNILPTTELNVRSNDPNQTYRCSYKADGGIWQLDNFNSGGHITYKVYNKEDAEYEVNFQFAHAGSGAQLTFEFFVIDEDGNEFITASATTDPMESTGGWQTFEDKYLKIGAAPAGYIYLRISGEGNGQAYSGNPRMFNISAIAGTEGAGTKALEAAKEAYFAKYSVENLQALINQAQEEAAGYTYPKYDQTQVNNVNAAIEVATAALEAEASERAKAYQALEAAINALPNSKEIAWQTIPSTEENPFDLSKGVFKSWQMEAGGNIGYAYEGGSVLYYLNVTEADTYDVTLSVSTPGTGAQLRITATDDDNNELANNVIDVPNTGSWGDKLDVKTSMNLPAARVKLLVYGEKKGDNNFVCNTHSITFTKADPNGIRTIEAETANSGIYTLGGQKVQQGKLAKGLYIVNGKKIVIK